jgi:hypothetical protein
MKVRVTKQKIVPGESGFSSLKVWFSDHVGEVFEVKKVPWSVYKDYYVVTQKYAADGTKVEGNGIDLDYAEIVMEKFEPKSGMVFKTEHGDVGFFIDNPSGTRMAFFVQDGRLRSHATAKWLMNQTNNPVSVIYDGMGPLGPNYTVLCGLKSKIDRGDAGQTVWTSRREVELTLKEIADKFGVDVEQVRIKDYKGAE